MPRSSRTPLRSIRATLADFMAGLIREDRSRSSSARSRSIAYRVLDLDREPA
ncbi:MAG: hypothetical protein ACRESZ_01340 [Methylococcales bacterium]